MKEIVAALLEAQKEMPAVHKSAANPAFKSKYVPLDEILEKVVPVLNKHGILLCQTPTFHEANGHSPRPALDTVLIHPESGDQIKSTMLLELDKPGSQALGSALTYARRYALSAVLGLVADEDDDGNASSSRAKPPEDRQRPPIIHQGANRESLLKEFKELQPILVRNDRTWSKESVLSQAGAVTGETYKDFDDLPEEALRQYVEFGRSYAGKLAEIEDEKVPF